MFLWKCLGEAVNTETVPVFLNEYVRMYYVHKCDVFILGLHCVLYVIVMLFLECPKACYSEA